MKNLSVMPVKLRKLLKTTHHKLFSFLLSREQGNQLLVVTNKPSGQFQFD